MLACSLPLPFAIFCPHHRTRILAALRVNNGSVVQVVPAGLQRLLACAGDALRQAERAGQRCGGPVLLAGLVLGLGVVQLSSGALAQTSRFSLELLILLVLQLVGPMLVALIAMVLLLPSWLAHAATGKGIRLGDILGSAVVGGLLLLLVLAAAITGGVLASPRADVLAEVRDLLRGVLLVDLLRSGLRAGLFLAVLCAWSQRRGRGRLQRGVASELVSSDLMVEGLILLLGLKLLWITAIDPLRLSASAQ